MFESERTNFVFRVVLIFIFLAPITQSQSYFLGSWICIQEGFFYLEGWTRVQVSSITVQSEQVSNAHLFFCGVFHRVETSLIMAQAKCFKTLLYFLAPQRWQICLENLWRPRYLLYVSNYMQFCITQLANLRHQKIVEHYSVVLIIHSYSISNHLSCINSSGGYKLRGEG